MSMDYFEGNDYDWGEEEGATPLPVAPLPYEQNDFLWRSLPVTTSTITPSIFISNPTSVASNWVRYSYPTQTVHWTNVMEGE